MKLMSGQLTSSDVLNWFEDAPPSDYSAAQEAVFRFYRCGAESQNVNKDNIPPPAYAFGVDAAVIISAFQKEYGIDLTTARLHWWRFSALLEGLISCSFSERVFYRQCDPAEIKAKDMRNRYAKLKRQFALEADGTRRKEPTTLEEYNELLALKARGKA